MIGTYTKTQFGFRKSTSMNQAIFTARRLQDLAEQDGSTLVMARLDWVKVFDKFNQSNLIDALQRMNTPDKMTRLIAAIYEKPSFRSVSNSEESEEKVQNSGIRQGCSLSPYLFLIVMSVLFHDAHAMVDSAGRNRLSRNTVRRRHATGHKGFTRDV